MVMAPSSTASLSASRLAYPRRASSESRPPRPAERDGYFVARHPPALVVSYPCQLSLRRARMRQAVIVAPDRFEVREAPRPALRGPGEVLVRTAACGICSGDLMPWYLA